MVAPRELVIVECLGVVVALADVPNVWSDGLYRNTESSRDGVNAASTLLWRNLDCVGETPEAVAQLTALEQRVTPCSLVILQHRNRWPADEPRKLRCHWLGDERVQVQHD